MKRVCALFLLAGVLLSGAASAEELNHFFVAPKEWKIMPGPDSRMIAFQTAERKEDSLIIMVRPIRSDGQSAQEWAQDEVAAIEKQGFKLVDAPAQMTVGDSSFVRMVSWNDLAGFPLRNEQYFCLYPQEDSLVEVAILGPEPFFETERTRIRDFLATFRFVQPGGAS